MVNAIENKILLLYISPCFVWLTLYRQSICTKTSGVDKLHCTIKLMSAILGRVRISTLSSNMTTV